MYIYESHLGGLYVYDEILDPDDLYCEQCGDCNQLIGKANNRKEAWELLKDDTDINGSGGWHYGYVQDFITENFKE